MTGLHVCTNVVLLRHCSFCGYSYASGIHHGTLWLHREEEAIDGYRAWNMLYHRLGGLFGLFEQIEWF